MQAAMTGATFLAFFIGRLTLWSPCLVRVNRTALAVGVVSMIRTILAVTLTFSLCPLPTTRYLSDWRP
jgi:hypothetical protein